MLDRGSIFVNSKKKLNKILDAAHKEKRSIYYEVFIDNYNGHKSFFIMYRVKMM